MQFLLGNKKDALATAKEILPDTDALDPNVLGHIYRVRVACWLMRRHGETGAALDYLDRLLFAAPAFIAKSLPLPRAFPNGPTIPSVISPCSPTGPASTSRWAISSRPRRTSTTSFVSSPPTTPNTASTPRPTSSRASSSRRKATPMPPARPGRTASTELPRQAPRRLAGTPQGNALRRQPHPAPDDGLAGRLAIRRRGQRNL